MKYSSDCTLGTVYYSLSSERKLMGDNNSHFAVRKSHWNCTYFCYLLRMKPGIQFTERNQVEKNESVLYRGYKHFSDGACESY